MVEKLKNLGWKQFGGLVLIVIIIIAFGFGGFGGGFSTNNQNNIAKINKTNVTTQDFMDYVNQSGISQEAIRNNLDNNIIEELLSGLISTTLIDLEIEDFKLSINKKTILKYLKDNKNFKDENGAFERIKYEKFLLSNNMSAPLFELKLKNQGLQKHLFDFIGAGTVTPEFLIESKFEENNKTLSIEYFDMENLYKNKEDYTPDEINTFIEENKDQLKVEYIDFDYAIINPKNLIGVDEFNQTFFDKIDEIEIEISNNQDLEKILSNFDIKPVKVKNYRYSADKDNIENKIFNVRNVAFDIIEDNNNYILYKVNKLDERSPDIKDPDLRNEVLELISQKDKFEFNSNLLKRINEKKFSNSEFVKMGENIQNLILNSISDNKKFEIKAVFIY